MDMPYRFLRANPPCQDEPRSRLPLYWFRLNTMCLLPSYSSSPARTPISPRNKKANQQQKVHTTTERNNLPSNLEIRVNSLSLHLAEVCCSSDLTACSEEEEEEEESAASSFRDKFGGIWHCCSQWTSLDFWWTATNLKQIHDKFIESNNIQHTV